MTAPDISEAAVTHMAHMTRCAGADKPADMLLELRRALTAAGEPWRRVEDGMPPLDQWVLIYCGNMPRAKDRRQFVACRHEYGHKNRAWMTDTDDDWGVANKAVTHWKPLQENPHD